MFCNHAEALSVDISLCFFGSFKSKICFFKFVCFNLCYEINSIQLCVHDNLGYFGVRIHVFTISLNQANFESVIVKLLF